MVAHNKKPLQRDAGVTEEYFWKLKPAEVLY